MRRRFQRTALAGVLLLGAACNFTWTGRSGHIDEVAAARGVKDVETLERDYETQRFWSRRRQNMDRRVDALWWGIESTIDSLDRHLFNVGAPGPAR